MLVRYHNACYVRFVNPKTFKSSTNKDSNAVDLNSIEDSMVNLAIKEILSNPYKIWNYVKIYDVAYSGHQHLPSNKKQVHEQKL